MQTNTECLWFVPEDGWCELQGARGRAAEVPCPRRWSLCRTPPRSDKFTPQARSRSGLLLGVGAFQGRLLSGPRERAGSPGCGVLRRHFGRFCCTHVGGHCLHSDKTPESGAGGGGGAAGGKMPRCETWEALSWRVLDPFRGPCTKCANTLWLKTTETILSHFWRPRVQSRGGSGFGKNPVWRLRVSPDQWQPHPSPYLRPHGLCQSPLLSLLRRTLGTGFRFHLANLG